jgi:hypothetical protein
MKKFSVTLLVFTAGTCFALAQAQPPFDAKKEIERIDLKLEKFRSQHQTGLLITMAGGVFAAVPSIVSEKPVIPIMVIGSIISTYGIISTIDSYKHLRSKSKPRFK